MLNTLQRFAQGFRNGADCRGIGREHDTSGDPGHQDGTHLVQQCRTCGAEVRTVRFQAEPPAQKPRYEWGRRVS